MFDGTRDRNDGEIERRLVPPLGVGRSVDPSEVARLLRSTSFDDLDPAAELALLARALDRIGFAEGNAGHITFRCGDGTFLTLPLEFGWAEVRASDVIRIDADGQLIEGMHEPPFAIPLHVALHEARDDCAVAVHNHPRYATIWSAVRELPPAYDQTSALADADETVVYDDFQDTVESWDAARAAVAALGGSHSALLANHGALVIADNIAQAYHRANALEWRCRQAWHVHAIGGGTPMPAVGERALLDLARSRGDALPYVWEWAVRREIRADSSVLR